MHFGQCQRCFAEGVPTHHVLYGWNVGLAVTRFSAQENLELCRPCVHKAYWLRFLVLLVGWVGIISAIATVAFFVTNTITYISALRRPKQTPWDAQLARVAEAHQRGDVGGATVLADELFALARTDAQGRPTERLRVSTQLLGDLLMTTRELELALQVYEDGVALFPDDAKLRSRLERVQGMAADPVASKALLAQAQRDHRA